MDVIQPKLPAVDRPSYNGDPELLKPFQREAQEFLDVFEGRLTESGKLKQVRAMLTGEAKNWLVNVEEDKPFTSHEDLLQELGVAFGLYDEQEMLFHEMMTLSVEKCGGTLANFVTAFRRRYNRIERANLPSFVVSKAMFLLNLSAGLVKDLRPRLLNVTTVPEMLQIATQVSSPVEDTMDLDAAKLDKPTGNKDGKVKKSRAPPSVVCHNCTGRGHFAHECPSAKKWKGSEAKNE